MATLSVSVRGQERTFELEGPVRKYGDSGGEGYVEFVARNRKVLVSAGAELIDLEYSDEEQGLRLEEKVSLELEALRKAILEAFPNRPEEGTSFFHPAALPRIELKQFDPPRAWYRRLFGR